CRISNSNGRRDRFRIIDYAIVENWCRSDRLEANHRWHLCRSSECEILPIARPICSDVPSVADRQQMKIGRITQFIDNFKCGSLLSCDSVRINGIHDRKFAALAKFTHDSERVVEIAVNRHDFRSISKSL